MQMGWIMSCLPSPASAVSCRPASSRDGRNQSLVRGVHLRHPDARTPGRQDARRSRRQPDEMGFCGRCVVVVVCLLAVDLGPARAVRLCRRRSCLTRLGWAGLLID